jgi:thiamine-phosphate pyrophosphorylase
VKADTNPSPQLPPAPFAYPVIDVGTLEGVSVLDFARALMRGGARLVQLRGKTLSDRELLRVGGELVAVARDVGCLTIINDRPDVARLLGADGVHLGQEDVAPAEARRVLPPEAIVGLSTHNLAQLERAAAAPVDYVAVGPVFATTTKAAPDPVVGLDLLRRARTRLRQPLVAIGGIDRHRARSVIDAGADGVAVIADLQRAVDPEAAMRELIRALGAQTESIG